jgi:16S rRNA processing protein RimM
MTPPRLIQIGVIGAAHGVRGEARVKSFTEDPTSLGAYGPLSDASGARTFRIVSLRPIKGDMLVARFEGVSTREAAEALTGVGLFASRDALPATEAEDDFYHADLIGLRVESADGEVLGDVLSVQNYGADDLLEIRLKGRVRSVLLPFTRAGVPVVDVAGGRVVIDPPEGALDEATEAPGRSR